MIDESIIHEYVQNQRQLLELELRSEQDEIEQSKGVRAENSLHNGSSTGASENDRSKSRILRNLEVNEWNVGLMGRTVVNLTSSLAPPPPPPSIGNNTSSECREVNGMNILPAHRITVGDEVEIISKYTTSLLSNYGSNGKKKNRSGGVVSAVTETMISIALFSDPSHRESNTSNDNDNQEDDRQILGAPPLTIVPISSVEVHRKLMAILDELEREGFNHNIAGDVIKAVFDPKNSSNGTLMSKNDFVPFNPNLDQCQKDAVQFCLSGNQPISLIHGPPGTGKTTTVSELIHQAVYVHNLKVLVTAPSNVAIDNVLERLLRNEDEKNNSNKRKKGSSYNSNSKGKKNDKKKQRLRAVRLGHPARINQSILPYSLEALVQNSDGTEIISEIRSELKSLLQVVSNPKSREIEKRTAYREMKTLRKEIRNREDKVVESLISNAQVVLSTNVGASSSILTRYLESSAAANPFDLVIIDEAAQALEVSCWIPLLKGKRLILAGDHCQLPPTITSSNSKVQKELSKTMFERIMKHSKDVSRMLRIQYRMHEDIANWASKAMYDNKLISHASVKTRKLYQLPHVSMYDDGNSSGNSIDNQVDNSLLINTRSATLLLIDTAGCDMFESTNAAGSRYNEGEASIVERHVRNLVKIGVKQEEIAVITPYNGQVEILKHLLLGEFPRLEIKSVDGFQGGEREAVILSLVRSSDRGGVNGIGFLRDQRRLNVAITRAKRQCAIVCDCDTVSQNNFLNDLIRWMEEKGECFSAMEYLSEGQINFQSILQIASLVDNNLQLSGDESIEIPRTKGCNTLSTHQALERDDQTSSRTRDICTEGTISETEEKSRRHKVLHEQLSGFVEDAENGEKTDVDFLEIDRHFIFQLCQEFNLLFIGEKMQGIIIKGSFMKISESSELKESGEQCSEIVDRLSSFLETVDIDDELKVKVASKMELMVVRDFCQQYNLLYRHLSAEDTIAIIRCPIKESNCNQKSLHSAAFQNELDEVSESPILKNDKLIHAVDKVEENENSYGDDKSLSDENTQHEDKLNETIEMGVKKGGMNVEAQIEKDKEYFEKPGSPSTKDDKMDASEVIDDESNSMNTLLGAFARERQAREQKMRANNNPKKKEPKGKKTGKSKGQRKEMSKEDESNDIDDMAFLNMQIEKVQNSHGRKIEGTGKTYKTIINGILIAKPKKEEKKRDAIKSDALSAKIKEAQQKRKAKSKKKK